MVFQLNEHHLILFVTEYCCILNIRTEIKVTVVDFTHSFILSILKKKFPTQVQIEQETRRNGNILLCIISKGTQTTKESGF